MSTTTTAGDADRERVLAALEELTRRYSPRATDPVEFLAAQYDVGLAWVHFPAGLGGLALPRSLQSDVDHYLADAGAPDPAMLNGMGYRIGAPTVVTWGTDEQKHRYLPPLFQGTDFWCQLFSEPGAGSDAAAASCRAERDGDDWVVNGQKVWTTKAHTARRGMLLARTNTSVPKHAGLTYFILDMNSPGVDIRPLRQMTGEAEFNEVYLTDVRIPDADRLGPIGSGWKVAVSTLMNERVGFTAEYMIRTPVEDALAAFRERRPDNPELRSRLIDLWIKARITGLTNTRAAVNMAKSAAGPEGSIGKVNFADVSQLAYEIAMDILDCDALLYESFEMRDLTDQDQGMISSDTRREYLRSKGNSIKGGTSEIMRNILGERVLGLPPDIRVDKTIPYADLPRN